MNVIIDCNGLQDVAKKMLDTSQVDFFSNMIVNDAPLNCWITADSVARIQPWLEERYGIEKASSFMTTLIDQCTVVPVRKASICGALKFRNGKFDPNICVGIAKLYHLDGIVTKHPEDYQHVDIPSILPDNLLADYACFQKKGIRNVPFMNLKAPYHQIYPEIDECITRIITKNGFILGPYVNEFEKDFANLQDARYCIGVSSGTAALHIALLAIGIGPGDLVLLPVNTFIATAEAVSMVGATPLFVDCDEYYNIDPIKVRKTIDAMVAKNMKPPKALIVVHLYGQPADMNPIMALAEEFNLMVIEDACQAHLARFNGIAVGRFGNLSAFSFYPGKNLGAFGEAGALVTNDEALYLKAKMLRQHGEQTRYQHQVIGHNYRMSAIQGAVLGVKLKYLLEWTLKRQTIARHYSELLADIREIELPKERVGTQCVYHLYVIQSDQRDELRRFLRENGIETGIHYPKMLHQQIAYSHLGYRDGDFPVAERAAQRILSLPMFPELSEGQMKYVRDKIKTFYTKN
jgi:dTDP-4-amino-4,6-dideoxygalactose transaminase